ncbi:ABC transporter substrate-binding protein [Antrihabitans cavernicola]|uniref:Amino acid ABC transporter substrate-binding protein n=1 Tax=Antrihabitans cavernicola TaxID=2495913 RepID=A0A5A7S962_9NOCA|nr:transporter substrate-binding domain-containing protein [Spelaeibacter cavernicola]KAA0021173.1 amino acid ABC transporter substrate-binding protein [Spelaeibacter cavernicola]
MPPSAGRRVAILAVALATLVSVSGCSGSEQPGTAVAQSTTLRPAFTKLPPTGASDDCGPQSGTTVVPGQLTIATDDPAYAPWFENNDPSNGKGFEGAVAKAVADKLGYVGDAVRFTSVPFDQALAPGPKNFDFDINQVTILDDRRAAVDFSSPYYAVAQSVVAMSNTPAAQARTLADLSGFRLGAQRGSTSVAAITDALRPGMTPIEFATTDDAKVALQEGEIDALVVDIPTAFQIVENQIPGSILVGQFPRPNEVTEFFGLVLAKNSKLTVCASAAVDALYADGTLERLAGQWIADTAGARILE